MAQKKHLSMTPSSVKDFQDAAILADVPMNLSVEIGKTRIALEDVQRIGLGSCVELDALTGNAVDIKLNGTLVAEGKMIELPNGRRGVEFIEILDARMKRIRQTSVA